MATKPCRSCGYTHILPFLDLGLQPASNALLKSADAPSKLWPLEVGVCQSCGLIQTMVDIPAKELFTDEYPYFSGQSQQWVEHCQRYAEMAIKRFGLNTESSIVIEVGGNDGTLLKYFKGNVARAINIEPCKSVADASIAAGVETWPGFFRPQQIQADLIIANNVLAHTPDLNGFAHALWATLKPGGTATIEFPWALTLIEGGQFDTIYHEHYSYFSIHTLDNLFKRHKLKIYDITQLPTHGGSLRIFVHRTDVACPATTSVAFALRREENILSSLQTYTQFAKQAAECRKEFLAWMAGKPNVMGYGAAAKGNTFLNYCGITAKQIPFVADTTPAKQGKYLPGSCIPIHDERIVFEQDPDFLLVLAWNWREEIINRVRKYRPNQRFVTAIPRLDFHG